LQEEIMTEKKSLPGGAILLGIVLIAIGTLVLLNYRLNSTCITGGR
jgi:hypothetical protein